jgi:hypothetical protein
MDAANAPPTARTELIDQIVEAIKPWKECYRRKEIRDEVAKVVEVLCRELPRNFSREAIRKNRDSARNIRVAANRLERTLGKATPEIKLWLKLDVPAGWRHPLLIELSTVKEQCNRAEAAQPTSNEIAKWCARRAFHIVYKFSKNEPSGTAEGPYCVATRLLYEAVVPAEENETKRARRPGHDFTRVCRAHLKLIEKAKALAKVQNAG